MKLISWIAAMIVSVVCGLTLLLAFSSRPVAPAASSNLVMDPQIHVVTLGVADLERSYRFYKDGLGFPTKMTPDGGIVFFSTSGVRLALYPYDKLAEDIGWKIGMDEKAHIKFTGVTLAHAGRSQEEVDRLLAEAEKAGGKVVKPAQPTFWGGYSGYFTDPDGYVWEVAYFDQWKFNPDGSLVME